MGLSVIIITKNNEKTIENCLKSVASIGDEIIVLDSGSEDETLEIAKKYTPQVYQTDWPGYGPQKQRALDKATQDWVLSIDSDEVVSPALQNEILQKIEQEAYTAYTLPNTMVFAGQVMKHGGCVGRPIRLFQRQHCRFSDDLVHERVIVNGTIGRLTSTNYHFSYESIDEWLEKMNQYTSLSLDKKSTNKKYTIGKAVVSGLLTFLKMYVLKKGFLDGRMGFVTAINWAAGNYYKYLKLALNDRFNQEVVSNSKGK